MYGVGTTNYDGVMARHLQVSHGGKASRHTDRVDVAARCLVYNFFVAINGTPDASRLLRDIDETVETFARAVERGWIEVFDRRQKSGDVVRLVALTDEGRRIARDNFH
ncbi:hypothetical protein [Reyranella soli]|uniref:HTH marR-type domain-containing protein n=1 Tax=Reyranella soli TaxID=1230389 RepID=A0A512NLM7_9HYPH|nr:hypothetical protein [Reyranella soli]GEP59819.1 hypothetical protein RSO01_69850 [Reyranella soli]